MWGLQLQGRGEAAPKRNMLCASCCVPNRRKFACSERSTSQLTSQLSAKRSHSHLVRYGSSVCSKLQCFKLWHSTAPSSGSFVQLDFHNKIADYHFTFNDILWLFGLFDKNYSARFRETSCFGVNVTYSHVPYGTWFTLVHSLTKHNHKTDQCSPVASI